MNSHKSTPRIIIHGGAGNITRTNLSKPQYQAYRSSLLSILNASYNLLLKPGASALDIAIHAVTLLENDPLFNAGHGAVYTAAETHELEASIMISSGFRKRGVGVMEVSKIKNPILLAREMLVKGEEIDGGGAGRHVQLAGETAIELGRKWGLEMAEPSYYWTKKRWDEHRRGLCRSTDRGVYERHRKEVDGCVGSTGEELDGMEYHDPSWDGQSYLPQGTVGAVVMDSDGVVCVATSTGGLTNKLPGRIGDTPTLGAGFWAEQWFEDVYASAPNMLYQQPTPSPASRIFNSDLSILLTDCLPNLSPYQILPSSASTSQSSGKPTPIHHAVALSGTGNGDSFLKTNAARTAAAISRFSTPSTALQVSVTRVAGPDGMLQQSAGDRWGKTGEGEGGIIGIEVKNGVGKVVADFNCGGMFRAWIDDEGNKRMMVFREEF